MIDKIPVVLASDKNYAPQMYITILSAILNKKADTFYDFYCLIPEKFSKHVRNEFFKLSKKYKNVKVNFIKMGSDFSDNKMQLSHITTPTYYRLKIADLLPQYEKAIYLDVDTIVLQDLTTLFETEMGDNYLAGVRSAATTINKDSNQEYYNSIGIDDVSTYINAGITIWNISKIRQDNMTEKLLSIVNEEFRYMDQDIMNLVFYKKILHLDFRYNVMISYKTFLEDETLKHQVFEIYGRENIENAIANPVIIHYASNIKPWNDKTVWLGNYWNKYAVKSALKCKHQITIEEKFINQLNSVKFKKIAFWGASIFLEELMKKKKIKHSKICGIIDKDTNKRGKNFDKYKIYSPEELSSLKPEIIIFSIKNKYMEIYPHVEKYIQNNFPKIKLLPNVFDNNKEKK